LSSNAGEKTEEQLRQKSKLLSGGERGELGMRGYGYTVRRPVQSGSIEVSLNEDIKSKEGRKTK
jgi:hypothetical protein